MQVVTYRTDHGRFVALVEAGRKWLHVIMIDAGGIRIRKVKKAEERFMKPLDYSLAKAKRKFRQSGRRFGITKSAKQLLAGS